ncbi:MAG: HAD family phosphatase [Muribaculaceae bacterium]|nr:HAD family phosphatase [Muribaculaceae bacterium]
MIKYGALFDLDGVLIDSESTYTLFWQEIERIYPTGIPDFAVAIKGTTLPTILEHYPEPQVRADITARLMAFQDAMTYALYPGVEQFLGSLTDAGFGLAMVTSSDPSKMARLWSQLPQLRPYFSTVIDGKQVSRSKPHPEGYLKAAASLGLPPRQCFVFEDSLQGLKAGRASGATVIGVATTYPASTIAPLADIVVPAVAALTPARLIQLKQQSLTF